MKEKIIKFSSVNDAQDFISKADQCDFDVDLQYNHITLDGKSIMAVMSLDFSKAVVVKYSGENNRFESLLTKLAVNE